MARTTVRMMLTLDASERQLVARAAALMGMNSAAFVRVAARQKAQALLDHKTRVVLDERDFVRFAAAVSGPFRPNGPLSQALEAARRKVRRA